MSWDRFRVTEVLEEVLDIFGYFQFSVLAYLHWKLPYCTALFLRTDLIRNAISKDSDDEALMFQDRFGVTEVLEEVPDIFGYFQFSASAYLHWKLPYCIALFLRKDFTVACVFLKTFKIDYKNVQFGARMKTHI